MAGAGEVSGRIICANVFALLALSSASSLRAQIPRQATQVEARADVIVSRWTSVQGGLGVTFPAGIYVRSGGVIAAGGGGKGFDSRLDLFSRFNLDPFREVRWGFYAGGGVSGRYVERDSPKGHAYLLVFAGLEGPLKYASVAGWVPAIEIGLGGGARIGVALRQEIPGRR
jgi:hypothetical protein